MDIVINKGGKKMPTGLTHSLEKMNFDTKKWVLESLVRRLCLCATLRDKGEMTQTQILEGLKCKRNKPKKPHKRTEKELKEKFENNKKYLKREIEKINKNKILYEKSKEEINNALQKENSEMLASLLKLAKEQLELVVLDYDTKYYEQELKISYEEFLEKEKMGYESTLEYYEEQLKNYEKETSSDSFYEIYKALIDEAEAIL